MVFIALFITMKLEDIYCFNQIDTVYSFFQNILKQNQCAMYVLLILCAMKVIIRDWSDQITA